MRDAFNAYPEFVCIDATYKLTDLRIPLYILMVEDSWVKVKLLVLLFWLQKTLRHYPGYLRFTLL